MPGRPTPTRPPRHLADLDPAERRAAAAELGGPAFRADQLARHYFARLTDDPADMTDLPAASRDQLAGRLLPRLLTPQRELACDGGMTRKTLWRAFDGALIESVLMRYPQRVTMCVSSQAGCGMACPFCATGQAGLTRNLSAAEIVAQVVAGARALARGEVPGGPGRVSNVVFMGMGEPLANYASVLRAVRRITDPVPDGLGISQRSVTVSTVGLVPAIRRLTAEGLQVRLAVSLHAPDDELRDELVPVNRRWNVAEVLGAAWDYAAVTGRRVSIEYALIKDINDQAWRADALAGLLAWPARAREPDPAQSHPGLTVDGVGGRVPCGSSRTGWPPAGSRSPSATRGAARSTGPAASSPRRHWPREPGCRKRCRSAPGYRSRSCRARGLSPGVAARWLAGGARGLAGGPAGRVRSPRPPRRAAGSPGSAPARSSRSRPARSTARRGSRSARAR